MGRRKSDHIKQLLRDLERGKGVWVTRSQYKALTPYLRDYKKQGRTPVIIHEFLTEKYFITLRPLVLI